jgi:arylformamidase
MNATLSIDADEAARESPARLSKRPEVAVRVWVGANERPAFLWQARTLAEEWDCPWTAEPGRHHLDVIEGMEDPDSPLTQALIAGL